MLGFKNIWDKNTIQGYPYEKAKTFLLEHDKKISLLFNTARKDWDKVDISEEKVRKAICQRLNTILKSVCNIGVKNKYKGKRGKDNPEYEISGLDIWEKEKIQIKAETCRNIC